MLAGNRRPAVPAPTPSPDTIPMRSPRRRTPSSPLVNSGNLEQAGDRDGERIFLQIMAYLELNKGLNL